ncbi:hypothetical protein [Bradyrhizobium sp. JYMT SZCCT0180]|uniref:hypothetical protein n=1 Tax=Bradyrhizobium sp. JYMT SZCCT0180 TaxID=2807666 RepID=UPI001BA95B4C|nr:hypothetical protein [Bradyrhizobium sp. JYMT SZCCT0180]MBR1213460.1 hypothetical protein [Bradyrhizobium sp. JYMT SZCCT0180]
MTSDRCARGFAGWLAGCGAATAVYGGVGLVGLTLAFGGDIVAFASASIVALVLMVWVFLFICLLTGLPAAIVIWASEKYRIRAIAFFGSAGAVIGTLSVELLRQGPGSRWPAGVNLLFAIAGVAAGLVYWRVAGRHAGCDRQPGATST